MSIVKNNVDYGVRTRAQENTFNKVENGVLPFDIYYNSESGDLYCFFQDKSTALYSSGLYAQWFNMTPLNSFYYFYNPIKPTKDNK